ncbi:MAG TPA: hypothetical protein VK699_09230 [Terriglobales bacterium]|jgi:hypothetical protein|nr:hypothetical protein [Terriglobales bacterium]
MKRQFFTPGQKVPDTGIYFAKHHGHKLAEKFVFLKGGRFPHCPRCEQVDFELLQAAPYIFSDPDFCVRTRKESPGERDDERLGKIV